MSLGFEGLVERHKAVLEKRGVVWWGKLGVPLGQPRVQRFNAQIADGCQTSAYLVQRKGRVLDPYRGRALRFAFSVDTQRAAVPALYSDRLLTDIVGVWVLLSDLTPVSPEDLSELHVASTGTPLIQALRSSYSGAFIVH
jgi:hypothetical protein